MLTVFHTFQDSLRLTNDRAALADLDHRIQAAMRAHFEARRALAFALAEQARERDRVAALTDRIADLESRAIASIIGGRRDLAATASESIAILETEQSAAHGASAPHDAEIAKLRATVEAQRRRLAELDRGRRLARVSAALGAARARFEPETDCLSAAETALAVLRDRQADEASVRDALAPFGGDLIETMADSGFGPPLRPRASDILARVEAKARIASSRGKKASV